MNGTGDTLISGNVSGMGSVSDLIKDGSGTLTLTGTNTYGGGTAVNGGTLLVNNTAGSGTGTGSVTVSNAGTTLGGTGTIAARSQSVQEQTLRLGMAAITPEFLAQARSHCRPPPIFELISTAPPLAADMTNSQVTTGGVTITNSNLVVTVGTTLSVGQTFTILNKNSAGPITGTFAGIPQGGTVTGSNGTVFSVSYTGGDGNDIVLTVIQAPVPEPSTWIGGALAIAGLAFTQRRRLALITKHVVGINSEAMFFFAGRPEDAMNWKTKHHSEPARRCNEARS